jgi:hypothetical protein
MKKIKWYYILSALIAYYLWLLKEAVTSLFPRVGLPKKLRLVKGQIQWIQTLNITNSSNLSIPINSANLQVSVSGKEIGVAYLTRTQIIESRGTTSLIFAVSIGYFELLGLGITVANQLKNGTLKIGYKGSIKSLIFGFPFSDSITLPSLNA